LRIDFAAPAESRIRIVPQAVADVTAASARYRSVWGDVVSAWRRENGHFELDVEIPPGASAQVELPAASGPRTITPIGSGRHRFQVPDISRRSG
jgi:alpha-L-rhamnosidase